MGKENIEYWLKKPKASSLVNGESQTLYYSKYESFKEYLDNHIHQEVTLGAIREEIAQSKKFDTIIWLNDHGVKHITAVIERASQLLIKKKQCSLNPKELFLLLNAIQIHDVGNFYGRQGHEQKCMDAIGEGLTPILNDDIAVKYMVRIAQVHGGKIEYSDGSEDKDTISKCDPLIMYDKYEIREQFLASVVRFADELADEPARANIKQLDEGKLPKGSEIFHAYAYCLNTTIVRHDDQCIELHFKVPIDYARRKFGKIQKDNITIKQTYLLDEIYERALKMHIERIYCSKYWKKFLDIERVRVNIEFYARGNESEVEKDLYVHPRITFTLEDREYPTLTKDIFSLCTDLKNPRDGKKMTGATLLKEIRYNEKNR
ncbi:MAG: hypothetical protein Q8919_07140 [Bacteroidota bacterium]|nr:hypothetical protein [Bacteroidota bacterium]